MRRLLRILAVGAILLMTASLAAATNASVPALRVDVEEPQPIAAANGSGADATIHVKAFDPSTAAALSATCNAPGGEMAGTGNFRFTDHYAIGTTTVTCTTTDSSAVVTTRSATVTVKDLTAPTLTIPGNISTSTTDPSGTVVTYTASATDNVDASVAATCTPPSGTKFAAGTTTVTCSATDSSGNTTTNSFTVTVTIDDTTPPVVTVPADISVQSEEPTGAVVTYTATATDNVDGAITPACSPASGTRFPIGTSSVACSATDAHHNTSAPAGFTVTVTLIDTTKPVLTVPTDFSVTTTSASGVSVPYAATATDNVDGAIGVSCNPASGSMFPVGQTTVSCTATDSHNNSATQRFVVTVVYDEPPATIGSPPGNITREANGPGGSVVNYVSPTASDSQGNPVLVTCAPGSGSLFALGQTTVTCSAANSQGKTATIKFTVTIVDTTAPVVIPPGDTSVYATGPNGASRSDAAVAAFLNGATAKDIVDPAPHLTNNAPVTFPIGTTTVIFVATDASGNRAEARTTLTVVALPPPPPAGSSPLPPLPPPTDRQPPDDVTGLTASAASRVVRLRWERPIAPDFDHVTVTRWDAASTGVEGTRVYTGDKTSYVDRSVRNGVDYRYAVVSFDHAGNRSAGAVVSASPKVALLLAPPEGAKTRKPPRLVWTKSKGASYYNVQLFLDGEKVLTAWPVKPAFTLKRNWSYGGRRVTLKPGMYRWYVWPGLGPRRAARYGPMLGNSSFEFVG